MKTKIFNLIRLVFKLSIFEKILVKYTIGKKFGSIITKIPPNHYQYSKPTYRKVNRNNINYNLDISDIVDWYIYYGFIENSRQKLLRLIKKGNTIFDIGANVGDVSMNASIRVDVEGKVFAFEPDEINFKRFQSNLLVNNFCNITIINKGMGNISGEYFLSIIDENNLGMNKIVPVANNIKGSYIDIITIDEYVKEKNIKNIDLIKIDVEGFEMNVLLGGKNSINRFKPKLFVELDNNNLKEQGFSAKEIISFLENKNYNIVNAETLMQVKVSDDFENCHYDIICLYTK